MLMRGDIVRIPADTCIIQRQNELALIDRYRYTKRPQFGIFISYSLNRDALVFLKNEYWIVNLKDMSFVRDAC